MSDHAPNHPYHLVDPSPWPVLGALAAFVLAFGAVLFMHPDMFGPGAGETIGALGVWKLLPGFILVLVTMYFWWRDVVAESRAGFHNRIVQIGLRYGMVFFITSEVMFFAAFFWAFFNASLFPVGGTWPPEGVVTFDPWHLPLMNTLILLLSGTTVTWAHHALLHGDRDGLIKGLACTVGLGLIFTCVQAYEYAHAAFGFREGIYSSTFYLATGFHGFHVIIGTVFLAVCLVRAMKGHFTPEKHIGFESAAWYWHFVDVVWLFLFVCVYWWGGGSTAGH